MSETQKGRPAKGGDRVVIRVDSDASREIKTYCSANGIEVSDFLGAAVNAWWKEQPAREAAKKSVEEMQSKKKSGKAA